MSRVLFVVLAEKGHVHPFIAPAQELARRGHQVGFYAPCDLRGPLARAGIRDVFVGGSEPVEDAGRGPAFAALVRDAERLRRWISALLIDSVPLEVSRLTAVVDGFRPQVIVADPMAYAAPIVATRAGLPWAGVSTSLNALVPDGWRSELIATTSALPRAELFAKYGLPGASFRVSDCLSPHLNVAWTTPELVGAAPPGVLLAGASLPQVARGDESDVLGPEPDPARPLVFMALGSQIYHQPRMFEIVIEASRGQAWQLVLAMGELAGKAALPAHVRAMAYAPQLALLARARAMISHGGANSVMEALAHGVPLLVSPICNDQPHNARFVAAAGAGHICDLSRATPDEVRATLATLCADGPARAAAGRIADSYRLAGGAIRVAAAIEDLLR
ncbi:MAG: glycosyltransferase family 1 protein [Nannocystis sp.]|uniref:glycosyltransferase n=1 Tax=Nannocystis sp. TaxID=1962667 RepID=UPI002421362C|nr:glycosyltransferase [Nannocystis sp.]MBK9756898.1 glycosyltransferase family 1 protein [Nannocystis sp.]